MDEDIAKSGLGRTPRRRRRLVHGDFERINLGKQYRGASIASMPDSKAKEILSRYCENIREMVRSGSGLIIGGAKGVGKTWAAAAVLKEATRNSFPGYFVTHAELRELQFNDEEFGDGRDGVTVKFYLPKFRLLVLDGLDAAFLEDKAFGPLQLERLISRRNSAKLATIVTTRVGKRLTEKDGDFADLFDIMSETMFGLTIRGGNLREEQRKRLRARVTGGGE